MADRATARANLAKPWSAEIAAIDCDNWRALRTTIAFQRTNAEKIFECEGHTFRQLLRTNQNILQAAKVFRQATAHVRLQECRRRDEECDAVTGNQFADGFCIKGIGMEHNANPVNRRQPQRNGESK